MDSGTIDHWRENIKKALTWVADVPYPEGIDLQKKAVFDEERDIYLVVVYGWRDVSRMHGCIAHIELIEDKIWIQEDGTEYGIASDLLEAGVPKENIVLGYRTPDARKITEFAVA